MGISNCEARRLVRRAISSVIGRNIAATPMLFMKAESRAVMVIRTEINRPSPPPAKRRTWLADHPGDAGARQIPPRG
jgi:hypothetical protein